MIIERWGGFFSISQVNAVWMLMMTLRRKEVLIYDGYIARFDLGIVPCTGMRITAENQIFGYALHVDAIPILAGA